MRYRRKISGPLLDRIDIHIEVPMVKPLELIEPKEFESSKEIKLRVDQSRKRQLDRFLYTNIYFNSRMNHKQIKKFCQLSQPAEQLLRQAIDELGFSARAFDKILKVARTIADLATQEEIQAEHIAEAIQYRILDRNLWL
jgi:magnesium chelatase family protein